MELDLLKYSSEIVDFLSVKTLEEIDYGVLDLSKISDYRLKEVLYFLEELLTMELELNYLKNRTGLFRVEVSQGRYCYKEFGYVIEADSMDELKETVLNENRIWYVFDDVLAEKYM